MALVGSLVRVGHADGRVGAGVVGGRVVAVVRAVRAVHGRRGRGVHRLGLDLGGRRSARRYQVLRDVLLMVEDRGDRVQLVRPRVVHRRLGIAAVHAVAVPVAAAAVRPFARVVVVRAVGTAPRGAGTVLRRPLGQVHAAAQRRVRRRLVAPFQRYRRIFLWAANKTKTVTKWKQISSLIPRDCTVLFVIICNFIHRVESIQ